MSVFKKAMLLGSSVIPCLATTAFAVDASSLVGKIIGIMVQIAKYLGIVLLVWGLIMMFLAFKSEDADSKQKALMLIIASIVLIAMGVIVPVLISDTGVSVDTSISF